MAQQFGKNKFLSLDCGEQETPLEWFNRDEITMTGGCKRFSGLQLKTGQANPSMTISRISIRRKQTKSLFTKTGCGSDVLRLRVVHISNLRSSCELMRSNRNCVFLGICLKSYSMNGQCTKLHHPYLMVTGCIHL